MDTTQPPLPPDQLPPIRTPDDVLTMWRLILGPLEFSGPMLWCVFISAHGRCAPVIPQFEDLPLEPDEPTINGLMEVCQQVSTMAGDDATVAFLLSRPGPAQMMTTDRIWARALTDGAADAGVTLQPIHLATVAAIRVFAADDLLLNHDEHLDACDAEHHDA